MSNHRFESCRNGAILGAALLLFSAVSSAPCDEPLIEADPLKKYHNLVQQLVSPNQEARIEGKANHRVAFPKNYDHEAQKQVDAARKELAANFEIALPALVEGLDDKRYCMTTSPVDGDSFSNDSVGKIVRQIFAAHLEVYRSKMLFSKKRYYQYTFPVSKEWSQAHKSFTLAKLQIEAIEWALGMLKMEIAVANETQKQALTEELAALEKMRDEISTSGAAVKPRNLFRMATRDQ